MNMKKYFEQGMLVLLEEKNIDNITVGEIIEEVGSCKGTFYKHYLNFLCGRHYVITPFLTIISLNTKKIKENSNKISLYTNLCLTNIYYMLIILA